MEIPLSHRLVASLTLLSLLPLAGCALQETTSNAAQPLALTGNIHGGQQPVAGAHVYVKYSGTGGMGSAAADAVQASGSLHDSLGNYILSDSNGNFNFGFLVTCGSGTQVYILATQGNPGLGDGVNNPHIALMTLLGTCKNFTSTYVQVNEVTTVAAVYALGRMLHDVTHLATSGTNQATGLALAGPLAEALGSSTTGLAPTRVPADTGTSPYKMVNLLANAIASCINTDGTVAATPTPTPCYRLFNAASV
jgi:hypothetical protein